MRRHTARRWRKLSLVAAIPCALLGSALTINALSSPGDVLVTDRPYVRHDGGTDVTIASCSSDATTETAGGDGGGNRQQNEPTAAINPSNPRVIVVGANDYCSTATTGDAWMGFYVSTDGGASWVNSLNPGYPTDTSAEGQASPIYRRAGNSGDPVMDWDNDNRLFYGGLSFNRTLTNPGGVLPQVGDVIVSTWVYAPSAPLKLDYLRAVIVGQGTPSRAGGRFNDKPSLRVDDWPDSPHDGNVYVCGRCFRATRGTTRSCSPVPRTTASRSRSRSRFRSASPSGRAATSPLRPTGRSMCSGASSTSACQGSTTPSCS